jgi:hypothetical protein
VAVRGVAAVEVAAAVSVAELIDLEAEEGDAAVQMDPYTAPPRLRLTVSWRSALPVKQALVKSQSRNNEGISSDQEQFLGQAELSYVVSASGFPLRFNRLLRNQSALLDQTFLQFDARDPIMAEDVHVYIEDEETVTIEYLFSREHAIDLDDRNVEFVTQVGAVEVNKKFKLEDMVFADELSL